MKKLKESDIQKSILDYLNYLPETFAFRTNNIGVPIHDGSGKQSFRPSPIKGLSDIVCVHRGRAIMIECKRPGNKPTINQLQFIQNVVDAGGVGFVVYSLDDVIKIFEQL